MDISKLHTMATSVKLTTRTGEQPVARRREPAEPYRILLVGDFSGTGRLPIAARQPMADELGDWRARRVDVDNWEDVLRELSPRLNLPVGDEVTEITFRSLDDFHPDALFTRLALFQQFRQWRRQLQQSSTFDQAAQEVRLWAQRESGGPMGEESGGSEPESSLEAGRSQEDASEAVDNPSSGESVGEGLLDQLLSRPIADHGRGDVARGESRFPDRRVAESWEAALRKMVLPYCVDEISPDRDALVAIVDEAAAQLMRMILHDPGFQHLEGLWRGVDWFLREELDEDSPVQVFLADISWADFAETLAWADDSARDNAPGDEAAGAVSEQDARAGAARRLRRFLFPEPATPPSAARWQVIVGLYSFGPETDDVASLKRLGHWLRQVGTPFIAGAASSLLGYGPADKPGRVDDWPPMDQEAATRWDTLCQDADIQRIGLIWPRFLLRLPYGSRSHPCESLALEERGTHWSHGDYLWGNSALLWGAAIANEVARRERHEDSTEPVEFGGMPVDVYSEEGEKVAHPCTEAMLGEREIAVLLARGIMPALSIRGTDRIRLTTFRSLSGDDQFTS